MSRRAAHPDVNPAGPSAPESPRLTVMHRAECELCDDMLADLERLRDSLARREPPLDLPPVEVVDVDSDSELHRRYGLHVPVLLLDGTVVCRHRLDAEELMRLLAGHG